MHSMVRAQMALRKSIRLVWVLAVTVLSSATPLLASTGALIVGNDRDGLIGIRAEEINRLRLSNRRVETRGSICLSSCTMYLGAGNMCASPNTRFGFHGPSYFGQPLPPEYFEHWSDVLASHYPPAIRAWFMYRARSQTTGYITLLGEELIQHGVEECK